MRSPPSSSQLVGAVHSAAQTLSPEDASLGAINFRLPRFSGPSYTTIIVLILSLLVAEQLRWRNKKRALRDPAIEADWSQVTSRATLSPSRSSARRAAD